MFTCRVNRWSFRGPSPIPEGQVSRLEKPELSPLEGQPAAPRVQCSVHILCLCLPRLTVTPGQRLDSPSRVPSLPRLPTPRVNKELGTCSSLCSAEGPRRLVCDGEAGQGARGRRLLPVWGGALLGAPRGRASLPSGPCPQALPLPLRPATGLTS